MLQAPNKDDVAQIICDEKVPFVTLGAGNPLPWFDDLHHAGVKCIPVVPNVKLAKRVQDAGADALVVEGMEAGGHDASSPSWPSWKTYFQTLKFPSSLPAAL